MISLATAVAIFITLLIVLLVFGLLFWLVRYIGGQFPTAVPFLPIANVVLAVLFVLVLIGMLVSFTSGQPLFRNDWH